MNKETARQYADECRRVAERYAKNEISKENWNRMAEAFEAEAYGRRDEHREMGQSSSEQGSSSGSSREF